MTKSSAKPGPILSLQFRTSHAKGKDRYREDSSQPHIIQQPMSKRARTPLFPSFDWCGANIPRPLSAPSQVREEHSRKDILAPEAITQRGGNCSLCAREWPHITLSHTRAQQRAKRAKQTPSNPSARWLWCCGGRRRAAGARAEDTCSLKRARKVSANC